MEAADASQPRPTPSFSPLQVHRTLWRPPFQPHLAAAQSRAAISRAAISLAAAAPGFSSATLALPAQPPASHTGEAAAQCPASHPGLPQSHFDPPATCLPLQSWDLTPVQPRFVTPISPNPPATDVSFPPTALAPSPPTLSSIQAGCPLSGGTVRGYGAAGDGFKNDAPALQQADRSAGSLLFFPVGVYRISSSLTLAKTVLMGEESGHLRGARRGRGGPTRWLRQEAPGGTALLWLPDAARSGWLAVSPAAPRRRLHPLLRGRRGDVAPAAAA